MNWIKCSDELPELLPYGDDKTILESKLCFVFPANVATFSKEIESGETDWIAIDGDMIYPTHWMYAEEPK